MKARRVAGTIDAGGVYASKAAAAGGWIFFTASALDARGRLADRARPSAPYELSEPARSRAQTRYFMEELRDLLPALGSSLAEPVPREPYASRKTPVDPDSK